MSDSFDQFMERPAAAARAYVSGDPTLVEALSAAAGQATFSIQAAVSPKVQLRS